MKKERRKRVRSSELRVQSSKEERSEQVKGRRKHAVIDDTTRWYPLDAHANEVRLVRGHVLGAVSFVDDFELVRSGNRELAPHVQGHACGAARTRAVGTVKKAKAFSSIDRIEAVEAREVKSPRCLTDGVEP